MAAAGLTIQSSAISSPSSNFAPGASGYEGGHRHSFGRDLHRLESAIQSGNTSGAQQALTAIQKLVPANANSTSPVSQFLSGVTTALSNNNIAGAQTALATFESVRRGPVATPAPVAPIAAAPVVTPAASQANGLGQDVLSLFTAIGSGNVEGAQAAYDTVTSLLLSGLTSPAPSATATPAPAAGTTSSKTTAAVPAATNASTGSSPDNSSFLSLIAQIGSSLSTGNIDSAQSAVDSFLQGITSGSLVSFTA